MSTSPERVCRICQGDTHHAKQCPELRDFSWPMRKKLCDRYGVCLRCLEDRHEGPCTVDIFCGRCLSKEHQSVMHPDHWDDSTGDEEEPACLICDKHHPVENCYTLLSFSIEARITLCRTRKVCLTCLGKEHTGYCGSPGHTPCCSICRSVGHHTFLHDAPQGRDPCLICPPGSIHVLEHCPRFLGAGINERNNIVECQGHCRCCLLPLHPSTTCKAIREGSTVACNRCKAWDHHTLLHATVTNEDSTAAAREAVKKIRAANNIRVSLNARGVNPQKEKAGRTVARIPPKKRTPYTKITPKKLREALQQVTPMRTGKVVRALTFKDRTDVNPIAGPAPKPTTHYPYSSGNIEVAGVAPLPLPGLTKKPGDAEKTTQRPLVALELRKKVDNGDCLLCSEPRHNLDICHNFVIAGINERERLVRSLGACKVCLSPEHKTVDCKLPEKRCFYHGCQLQHHPLLHRRRYWAENDLAYNLQLHAKSQIEGQERRCSICESVLHFTEYCQYWPLGRQDRKPFLDQHGLCVICLKDGHDEKGCHSREFVCGVNGCPEHHHPILHPQQMFNMEGTNKPLHENRSPLPDMHRFRILNGVTFDQANELLKEKWAGRTKIVPPLQPNLYVWYQQTRAPRNEVTISHEDFLKLYGSISRINDQALELAVEITARSFSGLTNSQRELLRTGHADNPLMNEALRRAPTCPQTPPAPQIPGPSNGGDATGNAGDNQAPQQVIAVQPVHVLNRQNPPSAPELVTVQAVDTEATTETAGDDTETDVSSKPAPLSRKRFRKNLNPTKIERKPKD